MDSTYTQLIGHAILVLTLLVAAWHDYKTHRIPNRISMAGWVIAPLYYLFTLGSDSALASLAGLGLLLLLTFPFFVVRWMGAGDVKLISSVGAYLMIENALPVLAAIVLTGGALGLVQLAWYRLLGRTAERYWAMLGLSMAARHGVYLDADTETAQRTMPYAISIALGTFLYLAVA